MFDKVVIEDQCAPCTKFYDEYSNVMTNPFADFKGPFENPRLVLDADIDDMCEYKFDFSCEYHLFMHKDTQFQGIYDLFPKLSMKLSYSKLIACMIHLLENIFKLSLIFVSLLIKTFIMSKWMRMNLVFICIMKVKM